MSKDEAREVEVARKPLQEIDQHEEPFAKTECSKRGQRYNQLQNSSGRDECKEDCTPKRAQKLSLVMSPLQKENSPLQKVSGRDECKENFMSKNIKKLSAVGSPLQKQNANQEEPRKSSPEAQWTR